MGAITFRESAAWLFGFSKCERPWNTKFHTSSLLNPRLTPGQNDISSQSCQIAWEGLHLLPARAETPEGLQGKRSKFWKLQTTYYCSYTYCYAVATSATLLCIGWMWRLRWSRWSPPRTKRLNNLTAASCVPLALSCLRFLCPLKYTISSDIFGILDFIHPATSHAVFRCYRLLLSTSTFIKNTMLHQG